MSSETIDYSKGYKAKYYLTYVDVGTWFDLDHIDITGGSINRTTDELMQSADVDCVRYSETKERLVRIWMDTEQEGDTGHEPLFTGWAVTPNKSIAGNLVTNTVQCYSVLKPAQDILLPPGWYAPISTDSKELIKELLKPTKAPIIFAPGYNPPSLEDALIAEQNENNLSMAELIVSVVGGKMQILGNGSIYISKRPTVEDVDDFIVERFDRLSNDIIEPSVNVSFDWYNCPNVFRAIVDGMYAIAKDEDPNSIFSIQARGREIWAQETAGNLNENESIAEYAVRRLKELQTVQTNVSYSRRFQPNIYPMDLVRLNYPSQEITGVFQIISQNINLGYNATTSEEVVFIHE